MLPIDPGVGHPGALEAAPNKGAPQFLTSVRTNTLGKAAGPAALAASSPEEQWPTAHVAATIETLNFEGTAIGHFHLDHSRVPCSVCEHLLPKFLCQPPPVGEEHGKFLLTVAVERRISMIPSPT